MSVYNIKQLRRELRRSKKHRALRDHFAGLVLNSLEVARATPEEAASLSYSYADAMMMERRK